MNTAGEVKLPCRLRLSMKHLAGGWWIRMQATKSLVAKIRRKKLKSRERDYEVEILGGLRSISRKKIVSH